MMRGSRGAWAVAAGLGALAVTAGPAVAADPIMPLAEVHAGMTGEARTVVQGTAISTFPVSVLDVQHPSDGPGGALILARAEGPLIEQTGGVAEGMSGSPVYVTGADGVPRVIGAVAYGTGDQAGVIIGITPIEQMLDSSAGARAMGRPGGASGAPVRRAQHVAGRAAAVALARRHPDRLGLYPLTRWTIAGASRPLVGPLTRALRSEGIRLTSIGPRTARPQQQLVPGATMGALLSGGDMVVGAIGTVTYVDGARVLGFGHTFLAAGRARFLLSDGYVFQTIPAPIAGSSYKLAEPGTLHGVVTADRTDGVTGSIEAPAGVRAVSEATDVTRGTRSVVRATLAPDERTLPLVAGLLQSEPAVRARDGIAGGTLRLTFRISSPVLPRPVVYSNTFAAYGDVITPPSAELAAAVSMLTQNGVQGIPITAIRVEQRLEGRVRAARLLAATVTPRTVRAGGWATVRLRVQPWRAAARTVRVRVRVPRGVTPGTRLLRIVPNTGLGFDPSPASLDQEAGATAGLATRSAAVAAMEARAAKGPGPRTIRVVNATVRQLGARNDAIRVLAPGQSGAEAQVVPMDWVIYGPRVTASMRVRR